MKKFSLLLLSGLLCAAGADVQPGAPYANETLL
jgi:hypothetical protein